MDWPSRKNKKMRAFTYENVFGTCVGDLVSHKGKVRRKFEEDEEGIVIRDVWSENDKAKRCLARQRILPKRP